MRTSLFVLAAGLVLARPAPAHTTAPPEVGYVFPPGGQPGATVEVMLGVYDWTPDLDYFVLDPRVHLEVLDPPGKLLLAGPPFFAGVKAYDPPPLPREVPARFVLPADLPPRPVRFQVANANGASPTRIFVVSSEPEMTEDESREGAQRIASLPMTVFGRLRDHEEVDRFEFTAARTGPITCDVMARRLGSPFRAVLEVHDGDGRLVADVADTRGRDVRLTFDAEAGKDYTLSLYDVDFRGHRSYVYRLSLRKGPPELLFDLAEVEAGAAARDDGLLQVPTTITARLDSATGENRYRLQSKQGEIWEIAVQAAAIGSPLDVALRVLDPDGKELAANDDLPTTTDAGLEFTAPAEGIYELCVSDLSGLASTPEAVYRLRVEKARPDFSLRTTQRLQVAIGGKAELVVTATRKGGFKEPVALEVSGLPPGLKLSENLVIPPDAGELKIPIEASADSPSGASFIEITGRAMIGDQEVRRQVLAPAEGNLTLSTADDLVASTLVACTMPMRCRIWPVESDERTVHQGSTHLAEIGIERLEGYEGSVTVRMASKQPQKFRQGYLGPEIEVSAGTDRFLYPCFLPDGLETVDAYRMSLCAVVQVADSAGRMRYLVSQFQPTVSIGITIEGGLLSIAQESAPIAAQAGREFEIPVVLARSPKLAGPARLELQVPEALRGVVEAEAVELAPDQLQGTLRVTSHEGDPNLRGQWEFGVRATVLVPSAQLPTITGTSAEGMLSQQTCSHWRAGLLPVIAEKTVPVTFKNTALESADAIGVARNDKQ